MGRKVGRLGPRGERKGGRGKSRWASGGPCGREERKKGPERERGEEGFWAGPLSLLSFLFLFSFLPSTIQTNLIEFKTQFEFKPINSTQLKQCCSMNAQTN
jgi:hypothetical protein